MREVLLNVEGLNVYFHNRASEELTQVLFNVSFSLHRGETLGIIGESGSGKTVTLLALLGLISTQPGICSGEISYRLDNEQINVLENITSTVKLQQSSNGQPIIQKNLSHWDQHIEPRFQRIRGKTVAMIFQNPRLAFNPYICIGKQISENIRLHTPIKDKKLARQKALQWLTEVKMDAPEIRYKNNPYGLSGGMCQRAMIAMALAAEPEILIADEPTSGLDATIQAEILQLLKKLKSDLDKSLIIVSHDLGVIGDIADTILVYYKGHIVESGVALDLASKDRHPYTDSLLNAGSSMNPLSESVEEATSQGCPFQDICPDKWAFKGRCETRKPPVFTLNATHRVACWKYAND